MHRDCGAIVARLQHTPRSSAGSLLTRTGTGEHAPAMTTDTATTRTAVTKGKRNLLNTPPAECEYVTAANGIFWPLMGTICE